MRISRQLTYFTLILVLLLLTHLYILTVAYVNTTTSSIALQAGNNWWTGTITIKLDGSIDPPDAPVAREGNIYKLIKNIKSYGDGIIVERDNIVIDGAGHAIQGTESIREMCGVCLSGRINVTIKNLRIENFPFGIFLNFSSNNSIYGNIIVSNKDTGIYLNHSSGNIIGENNIKDNPFGIEIRHSYSNSILKNEITNNWLGIHVYNSSYNKIANNNITKNGQSGIFLELTSDYNIINENNILLITDGIVIIHSSNNVVSRNRILSEVKGFNGIRLCGALNNIIAENDIENCGFGIYLYHHSDNNTITRNNLTGHRHIAIIIEQSANNLISKNKVKSNDLYGIELASSSSNIIINNVIEGNIFGISLDASRHHKPSSNNVICENNISNNQVGIMVGSSHNIIYHNYFRNNTEHVHSPPGLQNTWNDDYPSGGNYWSDHECVDKYSGPNQDKPSSDGICDKPYVINSDNVDRYPLAKPVSSITLTPTPTATETIIPTLTETTTPNTTPSPISTPTRTSTLIETSSPLPASIDYAIGAIVAVIVVVLVVLALRRHR